MAGTAAGNGDTGVLNMTLATRCALMTEALAARFGMEVAQELRCENVVLEVDNSTLAYALKMPGADRSMIAGICKDIGTLPTQTLYYSLYIY
jgi:hypothetical protein